MAAKKKSTKEKTGLSAAKLEAAMQYVPPQEYQVKMEISKQNVILARAYNKSSRVLKWILLQCTATDGKAQDLGDATPPSFEHVVEAQHATAILTSMGYARTAFYQNVAVYVSGEGWKNMKGTVAKAITEKWVGMAKAGLKEYQVETAGEGEGQQEAQGEPAEKGDHVDIHPAGQKVQVPLLEDNTITVITEKEMATLIGGAGATHRVLGEGGFGEVIAGADAAARPVAIKRLHDTLVGSKSHAVAASYQRAVTANTVIGSWREPSLMTLLGIVHNSDRQALGFVWDMADMGSVENLACDDAWELPVLADLLADACLGVDAMHRRGWVHRDLKPANLLVVTDSRGKLRCKVADYDLAVEAGVHSGAAGTVGYRPPEGSAKAKDMHCFAFDYYSIGACIVAVLFNEMDNPSKIIQKMHDPTSSFRELFAAIEDVYDGKAPLILVEKLLSVSMSLTAMSPVGRTVSVASLSSLSDCIREAASRAK